MSSATTRASSATAWITRKGSPPSPKSARRASRDASAMEVPPDSGSGAQRRAERAAAALFERNRASQALGMRITGVRPGWARVVMTVRADMVNGHGVCHGGDRKSGVEGKRVDLGGRRIIKKKKRRR